MPNIIIFQKDVKTTGFVMYHGVRFFGSARRPIPLGLEAGAYTVLSLLLFPILLRSFSKCFQVYLPVSGTQVTIRSNLRRPTRQIAAILNCDATATSNFLFFLVGGKGKGQQFMAEYFSLD